MHLYLLCISLSESWTLKAQGAGEGNGEIIWERGKPLINDSTTASKKKQTAAAAAAAAAASSKQLLF